MIGQTIANYKIISPLGEGGMAKVYLAQHQSLGNNVALKLLKEEYVQHPNIRKRFLAEARSLAQMSHPNIIKVTDLIDAGDIVAFVMEYIEGQTLEEFLFKKGELSRTEIESFFNQMILAVEYVHSQGLIHRDIKPSNFMVTKSSQIKLLDFGIAKNTNEGAVDYTKTGLMQQMGTPLYMSPEQVKNTAEVTKQTDIYSLGVVLWQLVMNKKPYDSGEFSLPEIQVSILKEPLPLTNTIWDTIIQKVTAKKPEDRSIYKFPIVFPEDTILEEIPLSFPLKRPDIENSMIIGDLEIKTKDLEKMDWYRAEKSCENLGDGWRLPTEKELVILFENKEEIGGFANYYYWSANEYNDYIACSKDFANGNEGTNDKPNYINVRAVRTV